MKKTAGKRSQRPKKAGTKTGQSKRSELVPQPHGGALWSGAPAHVVPGPGRPPNALRAVMRLHLSEVIPKLYEKWQAKEIDDIQYAEYLAKYAIGPLKGVSESELDAFVKQCAEVVFEVCGPEKFEQVAARLAELRQKQEKGE